MMMPDENNNLQPAGFIYDLIQALQQRMKFTFTYTVAPKESSYDELVECVKNNTYELLAADLTITPSRKNEIDFSYPIHDNSMVLVVRKEKRTELSVFGFLEPFSWQLWLLIVFTVYIVPALLITLYEWQKQKNNHHEESATNVGHQCPCHYDTKLTPFQRGFTFQPTTCFGYFQVISVWLIGVILVSLLTSNLVIYFKRQYEKPWLESIEDLRTCQKVDCHRIGIIEESQHEEFFREEIMNKSQVNYHRLKRPDECYDKLLEHSIDVAVADSSSADYFIQQPGYCQLETIGLPFGKTYFGIAMPKEWPYKEDFDDNIWCLKATGELDRLFEKWYEQKHCDGINNVEGRITVEETIGLFIIYLSIVGLILLVFVCKYVFNKWYRETPSKPVQKKTSVSSMRF